MTSEELHPRKTKSVYKSAQNFELWFCSFLCRAPRILFMDKNLQAPNWTKTLRRTVCYWGQSFSMCPSARDQIMTKSQFWPLMQRFDLILKLISDDLFLVMSTFMAFWLHVRETRHSQWHFPLPHALDIYVDPLTWHMWKRAPCFGPDAAVSGVSFFLCDACLREKKRCSMWRQGLSHFIQIHACIWQYVNMCIWMQKLKRKVEACVCI